jgi:hypothetical protein
MARDRKRPPSIPAPMTGNEEVPPGATARAFDRPTQRGRGKPGSGAGPRHAADDERSVNEEYGAVDINEPGADVTADLEAEAQQEQGFGGPSGGAVGGTPANKRAKGGRRTR